MSKPLKFILLTLGVFLTIILIDTIQAKVLNNKPFIKLVEKYHSGDLMRKDIGLLVDTYNCHIDGQHTVFKWQKYTCSSLDEVLLIGTKETFKLGLTLDDNRYVSFAYDVPYSNTSLFDALTKNEITIKEFLKKLTKIDTLKDGGSTIYKYDQSKKEFGPEDFYVISCNSLDGIKDIYIAKEKDTLTNICSLHINDLENVSMTIKDGTLEKTKATIIIKDTSNRKNIYGEYFKLEREENSTWHELKSKETLAFNDIGYTVNSNNYLELEIDWSRFYGELEKGTYRLIKYTSERGEPIKHYLTTEFTIK